jgi:hypothetical protein
MANQKGFARDRKSGTDSSNNQGGKNVQVHRVLLWNPVFPESFRHRGKERPERPGMTQTRQKKTLFPGIMRIPDKRCPGGTYTVMADRKGFVLGRNSGPDRINNQGGRNA